jgi:Ca2+-transporting ATPase
VLNIQEFDSPAIAHSAHSRPPDDLLGALKVRPEAGLSRDDLQQRQAHFGPNRLAEASPKPLWARIIAQLSELMVLILIAAAIVSVLVGEGLDAIVILAIVALNTALGVAQEKRAEQALAALRALSTPMARVRRESQSQRVPAAELTIGDIVELEAGDAVPADLRILNCSSLQASEAALTGESVPSQKSIASSALETPLGDRKGMVYMGTSISAGRGLGLVVAIGMSTELGRIARLLDEAEAEPTPLQRRLAGLGRALLIVCLVVLAAIVFLQRWQGAPWLEVFMISVSLAVAAIPEGLPAIVTVALAMGVTRLAQRRAVIRALPSVETLGSVTVIGSDKTGTLTRNEMSAQLLFTLDEVLLFSGTGYAPEGAARCTPLSSDSSLLEALKQRTSEPTTSQPSETARRALFVARHCNSAELIYEKQSWKVLGDPTEGALIVAAQRAGLKEGPRKILAERPFDGDRKRMNVIVQDAEARARGLIKGAPEVIFERCTSIRDSRGLRKLSPEDRATFDARCVELAGQAMRCLALAEAPAELDWSEEQVPDSDLTLLGVMALIDPPRPEVAAAIQRCHGAGIRVVMITGDHPQTAGAIARELGISSKPEDRVYSGLELDRLDEGALEDLVKTCSVFARVSPEHKLRLVRALQARGEIVAMTGDGVNDAPALKAADVGVAMGLSGTDVTREAAAMVLTDDNFATIEAAVEEGRGIYDNIQKFVVFLLGCNAGELLFVVAASILGARSPLLAIQILWLNLVTDGLPALALGRRARRARHHGSPAEAAPGARYHPRARLSHPRRGRAPRELDPPGLPLGLGSRRGGLEDPRFRHAQPRPARLRLQLSQSPSRLGPHGALWQPLAHRWHDRLSGPSGRRHDHSRNRRTDLQGQSPLDRGLACHCGAGPGSKPPRRARQTPRDPRPLAPQAQRRPSRALVARYASSRDPGREQPASSSQKCPKLAGTRINP